MDDANLRADIVWGVTAGLLVTSIVLTAMNDEVEADPSTLSIAAPIAVLAMVVGAWLGLIHLIQGRPLFARWR